MSHVALHTRMIFTNFKGGHVPDLQCLYCPEVTSGTTLAQSSDLEPDTIFSNKPALISALRSEMTSIKPLTVGRDLGVMVDAELILQQHVSKLTRSCFYQLQCLREVCKCVNRQVLIQLNLIHTLISSWRIIVTAFSPAAEMSHSLAQTSQECQAAKLSRKSHILYSVHQNLDCSGVLRNT